MWHGMATIRSYNQQAMFTKSYLHVVNRNGGALFGAWAWYHDDVMMMSNPHVRYWKRAHNIIMTSL
jgi:hypothetical protein